MTDAIRLQVQSPLAEIILDKPEKRNALSVEMWAAIPDLIAAATQDSNISIVVIHGGASGAFAAGADISEFAEIYATPESAAASGKTIAQALNAVETCPKPVLAAIDGACVGAGVSLAMAADLGHVSTVFSACAIVLPEAAADSGVA
ncbi:MAG: enoyl-CoA hydratase-related protein, partial [Pseudomonadota bacterium]